MKIFEMAARAFDGAGDLHEEAQSPVTFDQTNRLQLDGLDPPRGTQPAVALY